MSDDTTAKIVTLHQQGLTWPEIGEIVGMPKETARTRYKRWKKKQCEEPPAPDDEVPLVEGVFADDYYPTGEEIDELWQSVITGQQKWLGLLRRRREEQRITLPTPCGWAFLSDTHFGDKGTDYEAAKSDAEIIRDTDGLYAGFHGDGVNNWIIGKLKDLQRDEVIPFDAEWHLFFSWLEMLRGKLLYVVDGNHDNWTIRTAGVDRVREALRGTKVLYHPHEVRFELKAGPKTWRVKVRHKWRGSSVFNVTHGIEVGWQRGGYDFDIGIGGHTHRGTYWRPFTRHERKLHAVLTGTYKVVDDYGDELGLERPQDRGCGAFVIDRDGGLHWEETLPGAADYLAYLKSK